MSTATPWTCPSSRYRTAGNNLARLAAAFAALQVSADEHFTRLVVEPKHVRMAAEFLCRLYSNENCALDDYSQIARYGSQLLDYDQIEQDFMDKWEHEKHAHGEDKGFFSRLIFILHITAGHSPGGPG